MGRFDDYITSLEGDDTITPIEVAAKLHELHNEELGTRTAKIETLNSAIAEKDGIISERDREVTKFKAMNLDLVMQIPNSQVDHKVTDQGEKPSGSSIKIGDLFNSEVRRRHGI